MVLKSDFIINGMTKAVALTKGMFVRIEGVPYMVVDKEFYSPGKGAAVARLKLRDLKTGQMVRKVLRSDENVEDIYVDNKSLQYLYQDGDKYVFMDPVSFEQFELEAEFIGDKKYFLEEGKEYQVAFFEGEPVNIRFPAKVVLEVIEAPEAIKGDRVSGATKEIVVSTGYKLKAPIFVKKGDKVTINTDTGEYVDRAK